jgi:membrane-bound acyltransferase YfiQ involved in biofilm formation
MEDKKEINYTIFICLILSCFLLIVISIWNKPGLIFGTSVYLYALLGLVIFINSYITGVLTNDVLSNISNIVYCIINLILLTYFIMHIESGVNYLAFHFVTLFVCFPLCLHLVFNIRNLYINTFGPLKATSSDNENNTVH